ncbi:MAG: plasmid replication initiator TrfA [Myxococcota bacterium]
MAPYTKRIYEPQKIGAIAQDFIGSLATPLDEPKATETNDPAPKSIRLFPSEPLRSALFGIGSRKRRTRCEKRTVFACGNTQITYTGEYLNQGDLDVFMAALKMTRDVGKWQIFFSLLDFQKLLGLAKCGSSGTYIKASLNRLHTGSVVFENKERKISYHGHFIDAFLQEEATGKYSVRVNREIGQLYRTGCTCIDWEKRRKIKSDLGRRLQTLILSHRASAENPQRYRTETLKKLCDSVTCDNDKFKDTVRKRMRDLQVLGEVKTWGFRRNIFWYVRT